MPEVCTALNTQGLTKITLHEGYPKIKIEFYKEQAIEQPPQGYYEYICKVTYNDNIIQITEYSVHSLLRRLGHVLLALTEDVEQ